VYGPDNERDEYFATYVSEKSCANRAVMSATAASAVNPNATPTARLPE
jgi:hypothetical protein